MQHHIAIAFHANTADCRMRLSGALRFLSTRKDVDLRVLDLSSDNLENECRQLASGWQVDGLIFSTLPMAVKKHIMSKSQRKQPVLAMLDGPHDFTKAQINVRMNTPAVTDCVAELLRRRGFQYFAYCGTDKPIDLQYSLELESCFASSVGRKGKLFTFHENPKKSYSENLRKGSAWVAELPKPCGIFCYSDTLARDVLNACRCARVNVPEQVAIIGMDNSPEICDMTKPTLSSILPDFEQSGYLAAELLYKALKRPVPNVFHITYGLGKIIERASTQDLRGGGRFVRAATELIRITPPAELSAARIANQLHISRRLLEIHFKKLVGHGIHAEISLRRLDLIREQLLKTKRPIAEITESCGYNTLASAQIAFRKRYGKSMRVMRSLRFRSDVTPVGTKSARHEW